MGETNDKAPTESGNRRTPSFGARLTRDAAVGEVPCPTCGLAIVYTLGQVGRDVDCSHCGHQNLRIGESLVDHSIHAPIQSPLLVVVEKKRFSGRTLASMFTLLFLATVVVAAIAFTSSLAVDGGLSWDSVAAREGEVPEDAAEVDTSNIDVEPPDITLPDIEALAKQPNLQKALVQAQVWRQMLRDYGISEDDPRLVRLQQIIDELSTRLAPKPEPPAAFFKEFRRALADLRKALKDENIPAARRVLQRAKQIFDRHPNELAPYNASLSTLRQRLSQQELQVRRRENIRTLLTLAEKYIQQEKPTEAAENIAEAMFLALRVPLSEEEFEERSATVRRLEKDLRFVRGKRAVEDAEKCHAQNDLDSRNRQLEVAFELLPDLPSDRVEDLIVQGNELAEKSIDNPVQSTFGRELDFRAAYEESLRFYGQIGVLIELSERCVEAYRRRQLATTLGDESAEKVGKLILDSLEFEVGELLSRSSRSDEVLVGLANARSALDKAVPWQSTSQWRRIDTSLKDKGDEVAATAIAEGKKLANANNYARAVRLVESAKTLAGPDLQSKAEAMLNGWRRLRKLQLREFFEADSWKSITALSKKKKRSLDAWGELQAFQEQYPDSKRTIAALSQWLLPRVNAEVENAFEALDRFAAQEKWRDYRSIAKRLASAPLPPSGQARLSLVQKKVKELDDKASQLFSETSKQRRRYRDSRSAMAELVHILPRVLALNPEHKEAEQVLKAVKAEVSKHAAAMMISARSKMRRKDKSSARSLLKQIVDLDPDGKYGKEARRFIDQIDAPVSP